MARFDSTSPALTYYHLFPQTFPNGPPPAGPFDIDPSQLKREFLQLQASTHPDKAGPDEQLRKTFQDYSSELNVAYKCLIDPLRRSQHLLEKLQGIDALAEKGSLTEEDLLMEVLMAREAIVEAESKEELDQIIKENNSRLSASREALKNAFQIGDWELVKQETVKLSYWQSIKRQIDETIEDFNQ